MLLLLLLLLLLLSLLLLSLLFYVNDEDKFRVQSSISGRVLDKINYAFQPFTVLAISSDLEVWLVFEYASVNS